MGNVKNNIFSKLQAIIPIVALVSIASIAGYQYFMKNKVEAEDGCEPIFGKIGGDFNLIDQDKKPVTLKTYIGKPALVYFGYTYCPDVCPTSLSFMASSIEELAKTNPSLAQDIQPIMITIDPKRDTPEKLKLYTSSSPFPKNLVGLSGNDDETKKVASEYKVKYQKIIPQNGPVSEYTMDHTSAIYLLDRQGKVKTFFTDQSDYHKVARCIAKSVK